MDTQLAHALVKLPGWANQAALAARAVHVAEQAVLERASVDPFHSAGDLLVLATTSESARKDFESLADSLQKLLAEAQNEEVPKGVLPEGFLPAQAAAIGNATDSLRDMVEHFAATQKQLRTAVRVDKSKWEMDFVNLFYFDNVERLMRVLSPRVRLVGPLSSGEFRAQALAARRALDEATQELDVARADVNDRRQEVADLQERERLATTRTNTAVQTQRAQRAQQRRSVQAAEAKERSMTQRRKEFEARQALAQTRFNRATEAANAKPDDLDRQRELRAAQGELDRATLDADEAKADEERAQADAAAARAAATTATQDIDEDVAALRSELSAAQAALENAAGRRAAASVKLDEAQTAISLATQLENSAFGQARDNAPFLTNVAEPTPPPAPGASPTPTPPVVLPESDPVGRVELFAYPDERRIFIRGGRDDIDVVLQIIKEFDRPQGQAMMTLRTMEVNSDGTPGGARRALKFLTRMDDEIGKAQTQVEKALSDLRGAINKQVARANLDYMNRLNQTRAALEEERRKARGTRRTRLQLEMDNVDARLRLSMDQRESLAFYDPHVLASLGWRDELIDRLADTSFLNAVIPRPSRTVNLAQALVVLSLATDANRKGVLDQLPAGELERTFTRTREEMNEAGVKSRTTDTDVFHRPPPPGSLQTDPYASLRRFVGSDGGGADILGFQAKLVEALRFNGITHVLEAAEALVRADSKLAVELRDADSEVTKRMNRRSRRGEQTLGGSLGEDDEELNTRMMSLSASRARIRTTLTALLEWLQGNAPGADPERLKQRIREAAEDGTGTSNLLLEAIGLRRSARFRFSQANESAVNLTFRKYVEQVHRDMTDVYVKPAFRRINELMLKEKLGTGIIQETSILASNRLVARVDPRGSAQLAVGEEQDILEAARQLTGILGIAGQGLAGSVAKKPLASAAGPAGAFSTAIDSARSVLNALDQLPREAAPSVYGISTGNVFQVTPVIDPSGQALRFRFDHVAATQIREPDDTIDPQLPRIERHSINTEVQLGDQELRLISQFQANSRVGLPTRKSGGIPVIKDIPGVDRVPLIGWFVRRGGRNAQTQQSYIFCQTAMYPTLSEVLDVAVQSPSFTGL